MEGLTLDAESVRAEVYDIYREERPEYVEFFDELSDAEINTALYEVADDTFWSAYDSTRSDAIRRLLLWHGKED